jgi:pimeloyl-ACP methyl ester carboxylesterase
VLPAYSEEYRARVRSGVRLAKTVGRLAPIRRLLLERLARDAPSVQELTDEIRRQMADEAIAMPGSAFAKTFEAVLDTPRFEGGPHHRLLLLIGDNDPLVSDPALEAAVRDLGTTPVQLVRLATGGHHPHLESAAHPEWTARNVAEIVYLVSQMLLTSSQGSDAPRGSATTAPVSRAARQDTAAETVAVRGSSEERG